MSLAIFLLIALSVLQQVSSVAIPRQCPNVTSTPLSVAYYSGGHPASDFPLSAVSWDKYDTLIYAFAVPTSNVNSLSLNGSDPSLFAEFVEQAHARSVDAHISVGGWGGSAYFSTNVATPENRTAFVNTVIDFVKQYNLDGVNFDWEYPDKQGIGCNTINANDTLNFLSFLQELRQDPLGAQLTISAAVPIKPFDINGEPATDVYDFSEVLDYVIIMGYDIWGPWSSGVGPNAPLNDTCASPAEQQGSVVSAIESWTTAQMPVNQIVLGVAAYGHSYSVSPSNAFQSGSTNELAAYPKFNSSNQPLGDSWDDTGSVDVCGTYQPPGGTYRMWGLVEKGFLTREGNPAPGIYYRYDDCSQTPYLYNETTGVMISFDNARSFTAKGGYIKEAGLKGFAIWEAGGDYNNILLDSIRLAAGLNG